MYFETKNTNWVGDIAYWDGTKVKTVPSDKYYSSMGSPIGVVVIPEGFAPDGKTRIVSLYGVDITGNKVSLNVSMKWGPINTDTSLTNYTKVPTTDNNGSTSTGSSGYGYLPSDKFTGSTSFVDPQTKYYGSTPYIPSPYLGNNPNPEYYKTLNGNNILSDFNGLNNTKTLVNLGSDYQAANAAWKYKDGSSNLQWYLPGIGELGYLISRLKKINNTINVLNGIYLVNSGFWSSSEGDSKNAYNVGTGDGNTYSYSKTHRFYVRPFAII